MNALILFGAGANVVLVVIYWVLLLFCLIAALVPDAMSPYIGRGRWVIALVLFAIIGIALFGNPTS
jgi:hypothetical protein